MVYLNSEVEGVSFYVYIVKTSPRILYNWDVVTESKFRPVLYTVIQLAIGLKTLEK